MKATTLPAICCVAITAMLAAGASHWWSVRQFITVFHDGVPTSIEQTTPAPSDAISIVEANQVKSKLDGMSDRHKQEFYEALITKLSQVETQNGDLLDQLAETNRDLMKLEFRIDTHSESFRPMPLEESNPFSSLDSGAGVLPPRAEPISLPSYE